MWSLEWRNPVERIKKRTLLARFQERRPEEHLMSANQGHTRIKLAELLLKILSASLIAALRRVEVPGPEPPVAAVPVEPFM